MGAPRERRTGLATRPWRPTGPRPKIPEPIGRVPARRVSPQRAGAAAAVVMAGEGGCRSTRRRRSKLVAWTWRAEDQKRAINGRNDDERAKEVAGRSGSRRVGPRLARQEGERGADGRHVIRAGPKSERPATPHDLWRRTLDPVPCKAPSFVSVVNHIGGSLREPAPDPRAWEEGARATMDGTADAARARQRGGEEGTGGERRRRRRPRPRGQPTGSAPAQSLAGRQRGTGWARGATERREPTRSMWRGRHPAEARASHPGARSQEPCAPASL